MGKAGLIGQKIMATLASTGTPSHCLHPAEAVHGDLGRVHRDDVMLILSQSGETEEIVRLLPSLAELGVPIVAITGRADSTLGRAATVDDRTWPAGGGLLAGPGPQHAAPRPCWPSATRLALVVSQMRRFSREDFARFHPGRQPGPQAEQGRAPHAAAGAVPRGRRGRRRSARCSSASACRAGGPARPCWSTTQGRLSGIFTDSDLARLFEHRRDARAGRPDPRA